MAVGSILLFDELPEGSAFSLPTTDRGLLLAFASALGLAGLGTQGVYVSKQGSDTSGDGSFFRPFLTIQRALTSITDASSSKPYVVYVGPGTFTEPFGLTPWVTVSGAGRFATTLAPVQANWIAAAFAAAGVQKAALEHFTLGASLVADFAAISAAGTTSLLLQDVFVDGATSPAMTFTGASANSRVFLQNIEASLTFVSTFFIFNNINSVANAIFVNGAYVYNGNDLYLTQHHLSGSIGNGPTVTSTATTAANRLFLTVGQDCLIASSPSITGIFASLQGPMRIRRVGPDAAAEFSFAGSVVAPSVGSIPLIMGGDNLIFANNSADRVYSIGRPTFNGTRIRVKNQSPFNIDFTFLGAAGTTGDASYIGPFGYIEMWLSDGTWMVDNPVQTGTTQLAAGLSPFIPADIFTVGAGVGPGNIQATLATFSGAQGNIVAKVSDRVVGTRAGGGGFRLTSIDPLTGATVATDTGVYDWMAKRP